MTDAINDGGSAFPIIKTDYEDDVHQYNGNVHSEGGMSLRAYFLCGAIKGLLAGDLDQKLSPHSTVAIAMKIADEVIEKLGQEKKNDL